MNATTSKAGWTLKPETAGEYWVGEELVLAEVITAEGEGLVVIGDRIGTLDDFAGLCWYGPLED